MFTPSQENYIPQLSIDCVIFGYQARQLKVLLPKLKFKGDFLGLPGGFIRQNEDIDQAAYRILLHRTGIEEIYMAQFHVFGNARRNSADCMKQLQSFNPDPENQIITYQKEVDWMSQRFVSIGYYALVDIDQVIPTKNELDESIGWYNIEDLPILMMDHTEIVEKALQTLRLRFSDELFAFNLLPETFTMKDLQQLYETVYDKKFARNNFQKKMLDLQVLERLEKKFTGASNKAPFLYRFKK
jgi:8-oxo-dGTP diphosphatase